MAQIIRMDEFQGAQKRRQLPARRATDRNERPRYFCTRCRCESFTLLTTGEVLCVNCAALMRNVRVDSAPAADALAPKS